MKLKRMLSLLLAAVLAFGMFAPGVEVFAAETTEPQPPETVVTEEAPQEPAEPPVAAPEEVPNVSTPETDVPDGNVSGGGTVTPEQEENTDSASPLAINKGYTVTFHSNYPQEYLDAHPGVENKTETPRMRQITLKSGVNYFLIDGWNIVGWKEENGTEYAVDATVTKAMEVWALWEVDNTEPTYDLKPTAFPKTLIESVYLKVGTSDGEHEAESPTNGRVKNSNGYTTDWDTLPGNDKLGYTLTVTVPLAHGDKLETIFSDNFREDNGEYGEPATKNGWDGSYPHGPWTYNFEKTKGESVTFKLYYKVDTKANNGKWYPNPNFTGNGYAYNGTLTSSVSSQSSRIFLDPPKQTFTVTYTDGVEDQEIFPDQVTTVEEGAATPAFTGETTRPGYRFTGWSPEVAETVTANVTYEAQWEVAAYTVTFDANANGEVENPPVQTVEEGKTATAPTVSRTNWNFLGWFEGDSEAPFDFTTPITRDLTLTARWEEATANKGEVKPLTSKEVDIMQIRAYAVGSEAVTITKEMAACSPTCKAKGVSYTIGEVYGNDVDGYRQKVTFRFTSGDTFETSASSVFATHGAFEDHPEWIGDSWKYDFSYEGFEAEQELTFLWHVKTVQWPSGKVTTNKYWSIDDPEYWNNNNIKSATANFLKAYLYLERTVTYTDGVEGEEVFADKVYKVRTNTQTPVFEAPARTGYVFAGWTPAVSGIVTADATYAALWDVATYTVTFDANGGTPVPEAQTVEYGKTATAPEAISKEGYIFLGWFADGSDVPFDFANTPITSNLTLTAQWKVIPETVGLTIQMNCSCQRHDRNGVCMSKVTLYDEDGNEIGHLTAKGGQYSQTFQVKYGKKVKLVAEPNTMNVKITTLFDGYYLGEGKISEEKEFTTDALTDDTVIAAVFVKAEEYLIDFNFNGGSLSYAVAGKIQSVDAYAPGSKVSLADALGDDKGKIVKDVTLPSEKENKSCGYRLIGWNTAKDGSGTTYGLDEVIDMPKENITLYAVWEEYDYYHWIFNTNNPEVGKLSWGLVSNGTGFDPAESGVESFKAYVGSTGSFYAGIYAPIKAADPIEGYEFVGWYRGGELITENPTITSTFMKQNLNKKFNFSAGIESVENTITAVYKAVEVTITLDSNGGNELEPITRSYGDVYGELPDAGEIPGLKSLGWFLKETVQRAADGAIEADTVVTLAEDHTLIQKREIKTPTITAKADRKPYNYTGEKVTLTATCTEYEGLTYAYQWYKDGEPIEGATEKTLVLNGEVKDSGKYTVSVTVTKGDALSGVITENEKATAASNEVAINIRRTMNQLLYDANGGKGGPVYDLDLNTIVDGNYVAKVRADSEAPTREGYTFTGWNTEKDGSGETYKGGDLFPFGKAEDIPNGGLKVRVYAQWKANTYTVTLDPNGGHTDVGSLNGTYGETIELPTPVLTGYTFVCWVDENGNEITDLTAYLVSGHTTLKAKWVGNSYNVTFDAQGGSVSSSGKEVTYGSAVGTLPVPEKEGYTFDGWYDEKGVKVTEATAYLVTGNSNYTAKWIKNPVQETYTVTLKANGGSVSPKTIEVPCGEAIGKLPTPKRSGYTFKGWFGTDGKQVTAKSVPAGDMTLTAKWVANSDVPKTGDSPLVIPAVIVLLVSLAGAGYLVYRKKRG